MELEGDYEDIFLRCCKTAKTAAIFRPHASTLTFRTAATSHAGFFFEFFDEPLNPRNKFRLIGFFRPETETDRTLSHLVPGLG